MAISSGFPPPRQSGSLAYLTAACAVAALSGLLFGYDTAVISGAIEYFPTLFGLSKAQEGWTASSALVGCMLGVAIAGPLSDAYGRRMGLIFSAILFFISAVGSAIPRSNLELIIYRIIGGVGVGAASMIAPVYIAEISPTRLRGRMISLNQLAIVIGILVVFFVNYAIALQGDEEWNIRVGWRLMFGSEALPAGILVLAAFFIPESPRWLAEKGRTDKALEILGRINGAEAAPRELAAIREIIALETGSIRQLLRPGLRLVLLMGVILAILQQFTGINVFMYYAPRVFSGLGSRMDEAMLSTIVVGAFNFLFTLVAIWKVDQWGRKPLMIVGCAGMALAHFGMGLAYSSQAQPWVLLAFVVLFIASFAMSVGPIVWVVLAEVFPTSVRARANAIAIFFLWGANVVVTWTFPVINEHPGLVARFNHGFPFWVYGACCAIMGLFVFFFVPETKGKSLEEIEKGWFAGTRPTQGEQR